MFLLVNGDGTIEDVELFKDANWIHLQHPTKEQIDKLKIREAIPADYLTAVLDEDEISRSEGLDQMKYEKPILLLLQYPKSGISPSGFTQYDTYPFSIILLKDKIISAGNYTIDEVKALAQEGTNFDSLTEWVFPSDICLKLCWNLTKKYNRKLIKLRKKMDKLEGQLRVATENNQLYQLMDIQKSLIYMQAGLKANLDIIEKMRHTSILFQTAHEKEIIHDILVETKQAVSLASISLSVVSEIGDMFSSIVSNNLNNVMKILTSVTLVLTVPTIVGGIFGMNMDLPLVHESNAFWIVAGLTISVTVILIWLLRKNKFF